MKNGLFFSVETEGIENPDTMIFKDSEVIFECSKYNVVIEGHKCFGVIRVGANNGLLNFESEKDALKFTYDFSHVVPGGHLSIEQGQDNDTGVYYVEWK